MVIKESFYTDHLKKLKNSTQKSTNFLQVNEDFCNSIRDNLKTIYDYSKNAEIKSTKSNALKKLVVDNFDLEQIWQQIELQNNAVITPSLISVSKLLASKKNIAFSDNNETNEKSEAEEDNESSSEESEAEPEAEEEEEEIIEEEDSENEAINTKEQFRSNKKSIVDDNFFKLSEMEEFLEREESKMDKNKNEEDSDEESVDLFEADIEDDEDDEENDEGKTAKFKDFFFDLKEQPQRPEVEEPEISTFELRQQRLQEKIESIEEGAIAEKPWQLKGEITADSRPQNSLLEQIVEFDLSTRPAPVITEKTTFQLEDIIKQRIRDKTFDSVERKTKFVDTPLEYKKKLVLEQEKSKESLAQIYEREYLEQKTALENQGEEQPEEEPQLHKEVNKLMSSLFSKLDALSNFHFTPKAAIPELKIISNLPSVSMEEVTPVAVSDATLLAPEEIRRKLKGDEIGKGERTETDKKRERRKKKIRQKVHAKIKQNKEASGKIVGKKGDKKTKQDTNETIDKSFKSLKSSKAFFTQLEDQVKSQITTKSNPNKRKNGVNKPSAKRFKL